MVLQAGSKLVVDNVYRLELENGSRVLVLPATDEHRARLHCDGLDHCG